MLDELNLLIGLRSIKVKAVPPSSSSFFFKEQFILRLYLMPEVSLGHGQVFMIEVFCLNGERVLAANYFRKKAPTQILERVLNVPQQRC